MPTAYPIRKNCKSHHIQPSIHWAQEHTRTHGERYTRRIYDFELLYILEGTLSLEIGDQSFQPKSGELVYLQAGVTHTVEVTSQPSAIMLGIHYDYFDELDIQQDNDIIVEEKSVRTEQFCNEPMLKLNQPFLSRMVFVPNPQLIPLMRAVIDEFTERREGFELCCKGVMLQIFSLLAREQELGGASNDAKYKEQILAIANRIQSDCRQDWSNDTVADTLSLEVSYAAKQFKQILGLTPNKYIQYVRHQTAKTYLRNSDMKIAAISHAVGYDDFHYFSRLFKKMEGLSPLQYRKLSQIF
jgi:AraC-like DNA-binding protein